MPVLAAALQVKVMVPLSAPAAPAFTLVSDGVMPAGRPASVSVVGTSRPPSSVSDTVNDAVPVCSMESDEAESASSSAGACVTCSVICLVAVRLSPLAVMVMVADASGADEAATSVSVLLPVSPLSVTVLLLQVAVTPVGRPLTVSVTAPV